MRLLNGCRFRMILLRKKIFQWRLSIWRKDENEKEKTRKSIRTKMTYKRGRRAKNRSWREWGKKYCKWKGDRSMRKEEENLLTRGRAWSSSSYSFYSSSSSSLIIIIIVLSDPCWRWTRLDSSGGDGNWGGPDGHQPWDAATPKSRSRCSRGSMLPSYPHTPPLPASHVREKYQVEEETTKSDSSPGHVCSGRVSWEPERHVVQKKKVPDRVSYRHKSGLKCDSLS